MQAIPSPDCCGQGCEPIVTDIPGTPGTDAEPGAPGANGENAFDTLAAGFTMPAEGSNVTIQLTTGTAWLVPAEGSVQGHILAIQFAGYLGVVSITDATHAVVRNLANVASGLYPLNAAPTTAIPISARVTSAGMQGPAGLIPAGALLAANNLNDVADVPTSRSHLGLGTAALKDTGVANLQLPPVDTTFTVGDAVFATASGLQSKPASTSRTALGLGTMAVQNADAVAITGGTMDNVPVGLGLPQDAAFSTVLIAKLTVGGPLGCLALFTHSTVIQTLLAATTVSPNSAKIRVVGSGGAVLLTATPTITNPIEDGQHLFIMGTDDANTVTFQDEASLPGSKLELAAATRALGKGDILHLMWDLNEAKWYEISFSNN